MCNKREQRYPPIFSITQKKSFKFLPLFFQILARFNYAPLTSSRRKYFSRQFLEKLRIVPRFYRLTRIIDELAIRRISRVSLLPAVCVWRINSGIVLIKIPRRVVFSNQGSICSGFLFFRWNSTDFVVHRKYWNFGKILTFLIFFFFFVMISIEKNKFCCFLYWIYLIFLN